jgi:FMN phosphatase YigB (HAD superfamily)
MEIKEIFIDFWGTLVESKKRDEFWELLLKNLEKNEIRKGDFMNYWKENWFKSNITKGDFIHNLNKSFNLGEKESFYLQGLLDYKNLQLIDGRINFLSRMKKRGYNIHLVSDCGVDTREFIENSELDNLLSRRFYSFVYGTTKDEFLYAFVVEEMGINGLMIGDNYKRDCEIPNRYGLSSLFVKKTDDLGELIWKS